MANETLTLAQTPVQPPAPRQRPRSQIDAPVNEVDQGSTVEGRNSLMAQEVASVDQEVQDSGSRSTGSWILWFIFAGILDLIGIIPVLGEITSPIAIWFFRFKFRGIKSGKKGFGFSKGNMFMTVAALILSVTEIIPLVSSILPGCLAIVTVAYFQEKIAKKIKESLVKIAPAARGVEKVAHYAKYIPGLQEAAVVEGAAAGVARTGEGVARGESTSQAAASGVAEGVQKGAGGFMPGGAGATASAGTSAASGSIGVGAQYGPDASRAAAQGVLQKDQSIFEKVKARSEQEGSPYAEGEPIATKGLYADVPEEVKGAKKDQPRKIKPRSAGGQV